jgi:hypothetical protein
MNREASEYHEFWDQVDLSTPVELENVTPLLPLSAVGNRSLLKTLVRGERYDVPAGSELVLRL